MTRVAVLVGSKGRGSNMAALVRGCQSGEVPATVALVVSPIADNPAHLTAQELGVEAQTVSPSDPEYPSRLLAVLQAAGVRYVCLAGLMTKLPKVVLDAFPGRILNVHPALLPKFGGRGMFGMRVHEAVIAAGERVSGCTVHVVTEEYDEGPIVLQKQCPVLPSDTPVALAARVLELEHLAYPEALKLLVERDAERQ